MTAIKSGCDLNHFTSSHGDLDLAMLKAISSFISSNQVATICCMDGNNPYCFNSFYHFEEQRGLLLFKSSAEAYHSGLLINDHQVAGSILPGSINFSALQGIQFWGTILSDLPENELGAMYHARFPFAKNIPGIIYCLRMDRIKMTDNSLGFGKKLSWRAEPPKSLT